MCVSVLGKSIKLIGSYQSMYTQDYPSDDTLKSYCSYNICGATIHCGNRGCSAVLSSSGLVTMLMYNSEIPTSCKSVTICNPLF